MQVQKASSQPPKLPAKSNLFLYVYYDMLSCNILDLNSLSHLLQFVQKFGNIDYNINPYTIASDIWLLLLGKTL